MLTPQDSSAGGVVQKDSRRALAQRRLRAVLAALALLCALALFGCDTAAGPPSDGVVPSATPTAPPAESSAASAATSGAGYVGDGGDVGAATVEVTAAVVVRVVDGDTAVFRLASGRQEKVRFIGIDTPESTIEHEPYGEEASAYTKRALRPGRAVWLETDADLRDRYGRLLAYVWLELPRDDPEREARDKMLNARLALDGYATQLTIPPNVRYARLFAECVAEARAAKRGLWGIEP
ncbi:MAG: thermonuclease family protein [Anaerosomatales bacterium]|nr:thermonuclease family protein [Anaerosomatales bacterium]